MLNFKKISSETRAITPALAVEFSTMQASITERDLISSRLDYLKARILEGSALSFIWAKAKVAETGDVYRINGNHSSSVLAAMNGEMPEGLTAHIDTYEVPTVKELPWLFRQFDSRHSTRTPIDISGAYQMVVPELRNASRVGALKAIRGISWYEKKIVGTNIPTGEDLYTLYNVPDYHDFIHVVDRIYSPKKTGEFVAAVLGTMYGTFVLDPKASETFWTDVAKQGGGNDEKHPATVLDAWLLAAVKDKSEKKPRELEIYRACVVAWNAFRNQRSLDKISKWDPKKGAPELE